MDGTFVYKQGADPAFQTDADRAAELGRQANVAYDVKAHVTFKGDSLREGIFGDGKEAKTGVDMVATTQETPEQGVEVDANEVIQAQGKSANSFSMAPLPAHRHPAGPALTTKPCTKRASATGSPTYTV